MSAAANISIAKGADGDWYNRAVPANVTDPETYRAARGFEAYFAQHLMKEMLGKADLIGGKGHGGKIFQEMFLEKVGDEMAMKGDLGITDLMYRRIMEGKGLKPYSDMPDSGGPRALEDDRDLGPAPKTFTVVADETSAETKQVRNGRVDAELPLPDSVLRYRHMVEEAGRRYDLEPELLFAVINQESAGDATAVSHAGAKGLMQLMDFTAEEMGVKDSFDPWDNIQGGAKYLRRQLDRFGERDLALAAYNAGPGAVNRYGGIPPYNETQSYVRRINAKYNQLKTITGQSPDAIVQPSGLADARTGNSIRTQQQDRG